MADIADLTGMITTIGVFFAPVATPNTYTYMCGMNARSFNRTRDRKTDSAVMACGPDAAIEVLSSAGALDWTVSGGATMHLDTFDYLSAWMEGGGPRNIQIRFYKGPKKALVVHGYIQGTANLTQLTVDQGDAEGLTTASITVNKAGPSTYTAGAPPAPAGGGNP